MRNHLPINLVLGHFLARQGNQAHMMRIDNQQNKRHILVAVFKDILERVFQPVASITPDLRKEVIALWQTEGGRRNRSMRIQRCRLQRLHALIDLRPVIRRSAKQVAQRLGYNHPPACFGGWRPALTACASPR